MTAARIRRSALMAAIAALAGGCGFTDLDLDLAFAENAARRGAIGELEPTSFALSELGDERPDRDRVGYQKNGYGMNVSDVRAAAPVPSLFRDAIAAELRANGHALDPRSRLRIQGAVTLFWVELQPGLSMTAVATAACTLRVLDRDAGAIHEKQYTGHYTYRNTSAFRSAYEQALRVALERMAWEIALDRNLVAAVREAKSRAR